MYLSQVISISLMYLSQRLQDRFVVENNCLIKKHKTYSDSSCDSNFYLKLENMCPVLKQKHRNGNFPQIKLAMGLSHVPLCDFVV